jgi:hypothetical protein
VDRETEPDDYDPADGPSVLLSPIRQQREEMDVDDALEYASEEDLVADTAEGGAEDFVLSSGKKVRLRGLTRDEHLWIGKGTEDAAVIEARMVSTALVIPAMSEAKVRRWQKSGRSQAVSEISDRIRDLSGFGKGADKSSVRTVRGES